MFYWRVTMFWSRGRGYLWKCIAEWREYLVIASSIAFIGSTQLALGSESVRTCNVKVLSPLAPVGMSIESAQLDDAENGACVLTGRVKTRSQGLPDGSARFTLTLPRDWSHRFVFWGVGGYGGDLSPAVTESDLHTALQRGYATGITDTGHKAPTTKLVDASFALKKAGLPDRAAKADYYFRATHDVTVALKEFTKAYYGMSIRYSYFDGCSNGGRQAMVEAEQYPDDYDGVIAGDPALDLRLELSDIRVHKAYLSHPDSRLWGRDLTLVDNYVLKQCDELDGVKDGVIQDAGACHPDLAALICRGGQTTGCLTAGQVNTLLAFTSPTLNEKGQEIYPGFPLGYYMQTRAQQWQFGTDDLPTPPTGQPWPEDTGPYEYQFDDQTLKYIVLQNPEADFMAYPFGDSQTANSAVLKDYDDAVQEGDARDPRRLLPFLHRNGKLIMFHGYADTSISPFGSIAFYRELLAAGKQDSLAPQSNVALFMVPGMGHCAGGATPTIFDTLSALQDWTERGVFPHQIIAVSENAPEYSMPLCPYPQMAKLTGNSPHRSNDWTCTIAPKR
jgi:feruloyl esterase